MKAASFCLLYLGHDDVEWVLVCLLVCVFYLFVVSYFFLLVFPLRNLLFYHFLGRFYVGLFPSRENGNPIPMSELWSLLDQGNYLLSPGISSLRTPLNIPDSHRIKIQSVASLGMLCCDLT